jgi:hypothetical protein
VIWTSGWKDPAVKMNGGAEEAPAYIFRTRSEMNDAEALCAAKCTDSALRWEADWTEKSDCPSDRCSLWASHRATVRR